MCVFWLCHQHKIWWLYQDFPVPSWGLGYIMFYHQYLVWVCCCNFVRVRNYSTTTGVYLELQYWLLSQCLTGFLYSVTDLVQPCSSRQSHLEFLIVNLLVSPVVSSSWSKCAVIVRYSRFRSSFLSITNEYIKFN